MRKLPNLKIISLYIIITWCIVATAGVWVNSARPGEVREMFAYSFIIPILLAAFFYGQLGGLLVALSASFVSGSLIITNAALVDTPFVQRLMFQVVYYNTVALVTSHLSEREQTARQRLSEQVERLTLMRSIDRAITAGDDMKSILYIILDGIISILKVDAVGVMLIDPETRRLEYKAGLGFQGSTVAWSTLNLDQGFAGQAVSQRKRVAHPDLEAVEDGFAERLIEEGFASYFCAPLVAKGVVQGVLEIYHRTPLNPDREWLEFMETLAAQAAVAIDNGRLMESLHQSNYRLVRAYEETLGGWSQALELRSHESKGHTRKLAELAVQLGQAMEMNEVALQHLYRGALLHDIGMVAIPDSILLKSGPLNAEEQQTMRKHALYGQMLLAPVDFLSQAVEVPYLHHECWDGSGYPLGLKGEAIPLAARVFAVVDAWDALRSDRPFRPAWSAEKALEYLCQQAGVQFDPQVVEAFVGTVLKKPYPRPAQAEAGGADSASEPPGLAAPA